MTTPLQDIAIVGAGGLGREVLVLLRQINQVQPTWNPIGFYDDQPQAPIHGLPYLGTPADLQHITQPLHVVLAIGNCQVKEKIAQQLTHSLLRFPTLLHPSVTNDAFQLNQIGEGSIICQNTVLSTHVRIGKHVLINWNSTIGHDAVLEDFCSLMPQVAISGHVVLQKGVYVGVHACVLQGLTMGEYCTLGAGTVVTKDIPRRCTAVGVPARILKKA